MPIDPFVAAATPAAPDPFVAAATPPPQAQADPYVAAATSRPQTDPFVAAATRPTAAPFTPRAGVDLANLQPDVRNALYAAAGDLAKRGIDISTYVNDGFRTRAQQQHQWDRKQAGLNPYPVARPGTSPHESGLAVDIGIGRIPADQRQTVLDTLRAHGLIQNVAHDPVHFQLARGIAQGMSEGYHAPAAAAPAQQDGPQWPSLGQTALEGIKAIPDAFRVGVEHLVAGLGAGAAAGLDTGMHTTDSPVPAAIQAFIHQINSPVPYPAGNFINAAANTYVGQAGQQLNALQDADQARQSAGRQPDLIHRPLQGVEALLSPIQPALAAGRQAAAQPQEVPFRAVRQFLGPDSSTPEKILATALDLSAGGMTDPTLAALTVLGDPLSAPVLQGAAKMVMQSKAGQATLGRIGSVLNPVGQRLMDISLKGSAREGATPYTVQDSLGDLGFGPNQALKESIILPHQHEVTAGYQPLVSIANDVSHVTTQAQKASPAVNDAIEAYQAGHEGANPVAEMIRRATLERASAGPQPTPYDTMTPKQKRLFDRKYSGFGVTAQYVLDKADAINHYADTLSGFLADAGKTATVNAGGAAEPLVPREALLEAMFGEAPVATGTRAKGAIRRGADVYGFQPTQEWNLRQLVSNLVADGTYVKPVGPEGVQRNWQAIPDHAAFGPLAGQQMPRPLANLLINEASSAGLRAGPVGFVKSDYIRSKDVAESGWKGFVSFTKRNMLANPATQAAIALAHGVGTQIGLRRLGVSGADLPAQTLQAAKDLWRYNTTGKPTADMADAMSAMGSSFTQSLSDTARGVTDVPTQVKKIVFAGKPWAMESDRVGTNELASFAVGKVLNTPGRVAADVQGFAEKSVRLAMYRMVRAEGYSVEDAAAQVGKFRFDYSNRPALLEMLDKGGLWSFNAFPTKALGLAIDTLVNDPALVARYPRLRQIAYQGVDTSQLKPEQKGALAIPIGDNETLDMGRYMPFNNALQGAQTFARDPSLSGALAGALTAAGLSNQGDDPAGAALTRPIFAGPALAALGMKIAGGKLVPLLRDGEAPGDKGALVKRELQKDLLPSLLGGRGSLALEDAAQGVAPSGGRLAEAQPFGDTAMRYVLGLKTEKGENPIDQQRRVGPTIGPHATVAGAFYKGAITAAQADPNNPYTKTVADMNIKEVGREVQQAQNATRAAVADPRNVVGGQLTPDGVSRLRNAAQWNAALMQRMRGAAAEQKAWEARKQQGAR